MRTINSIQELKQSLALSTRRGIPFLLSGFLFWTITGVMGVFLSLELLKWVYIFGVGLVFPVAILIALALKIDIFPKGNTLGNLAGILGGVQVMFAPIIILLSFKEPAYLPFGLGVLNGAHFLPYAWIYNSKAYLFLTIGTVIMATLTGVYFSPDTYIITPLSIAAIFLISIGGLLVESKNDRKNIR